MVQKPCVNGIVAAVLSASIIPLHGALAKEKSHRQKAVVKPRSPYFERTLPTPDLRTSSPETSAARVQ